MIKTMEKLVGIKEEIIAEIVKSSPAVGLSAWTLNEWVILLTGIYVTCQTIILLRKHYWREIDRRKSKKT